ncbi:MAG TPA: hypothetical protein VKT32_16975 [Chthonomonadaceae bacterium]|nr:hypothetical protein [Chthonomonadaceae bacterium]
MSRPIRKSYAAKGELTDNQIACYPSVMGVLDRGGDVIYPRAFTRRRDTLKEFLASGFVAVGHRWDELPIAYPVSAREAGNCLESVAVFHSTQAAQDARTVARERLANGLKVGLSIGFMPDYEEGVHYFDNGRQLLEHAEGLGCDMSLFDVKGIAACKSWCRGLSIIDALYEYSIAPAPMNADATATDVKSLAEITTERDFEEFLREAGYSRKNAKIITLYGFKALRRDAGSAPELEESAETAARLARFQQLARRHELLLTMNPV